MHNSSFHQLFSNIKKRITRIYGNDFLSLYLCVDGCVLEIRYYDKTYIDFAKKTFKGVIVEKTKPDSIIWCIEDNIAEYIPSEYVGKMVKGGVLKGQDDSAEIQIINEYELTGADYISSEYYYIRSNSIDVTTCFYGHPLHPLFSMWARYNKRLLIHGAAIGKNGNGILIGARGGAGKSTLSVSWMLNGGEIVGDDYIIIRKDKDLMASKLYTSVGLNADMQELLNIKLETFLTAPKRNNKKFYDASSYKFVDSMKIKAIVFPLLNTHEDSIPIIRPTPPSKVMVQLIHSTIIQVGEKHNTAFIKKMASMLSGIPTYEILLSSDINKNIECINKFLDTNI